MDMTAAMQHMTGQARMQFRGVQARAMAAIQQGQSPMVAIMPTGGGKSMLFMLPAWAVPGGTTIVVVPLISLRQDMARRCRQLGVSCVAWDRQRPPDEAAIVLVTPEAAVTGDFQSFINRLVMMRRLDRVVVDECHIIMNGQKDFRPQMAQLGRLVRARCPMVYLTATLPPQMEGEFSRRIHYPRDQIYVYRGRTSRGNVAYRVWRPMVESPYQWERDPGIITFMQARIQRARQAGSSSGKVVIYTSTVRQAQAMAEVFGCEAYHSKQVDRAGVLERFIQGITDMIAATNALGMGVDIPDIRVIFHIGMPRTLLDYAQESGRAGRDGQASEAIIIQPDGMDEVAGGSKRPREEVQDRDLGIDLEQEAQRVRRYMAGGGCRRVVLDEYLDGIIDGYERQRCGDASGEEDEQACDHCDPGWQEAAHVAGGGGSTPASGSPAVGVRGWHDTDTPPAAPRPGQATTPPATNPGFRFGEDDSPASSGIISQIGYEPPAEAEAEAEQAAAMTPPATAEALGLGFRSDPASGRADPGDGEAGRGQGRVGPSSLQAVRVPASASGGGSGQASQWAAGDIHFQQQHARQWLDEEFGEREARRWQDRCYICAMAQQDDQHDLYLCRHASSQAAKQWMVQVRQKIKYARYIGCFTCGMPQTICHGWKGAAATGCEFRGVLIPMVASMLYGPWGEGIQAAWQRRLQGVGIDSQDIEAVTKWLGQRSTHGHSQLFESFCWLRGISQEVEGGW
ncbi:P-loop containing nucleoside triphosphate hydrolase protein [Aspergillus pseudodeflectus]|uniref:DNA 3'-5' helicase n=1 Tax=Aspergillus pseudodeflectus TaxID=176178 RepID=A0ABR4J796_9EURO